MDPTVLGVLIGGGMTLVGSFAALWGQLRSRKMDLEAERSKRQEAAADGRRERYAEFVGAYFATHGRLLDVLDLVLSRRAGWDQSVSRILQSEAHQVSVAALNHGRAWIAIICRDQTLPDDLDRLCRVFDDFGERLLESRQLARDDEEVDAAALRAQLEEMESLFDTILGKVRAEDAVLGQ